MTRKSQARLERDAAAAAIGENRKGVSERFAEARMLEAKEHQYYQNNTCWDDLKQLSDEFAPLLLQYTSMMMVIDRPGIKEMIDDYRTFSNNTSILARDLTELKNEYLAIRSEHVDKTGAAKNQEENNAAIDLGMRYTALHEKHDGVVRPTALHILEQLNTAEQKLKEKLQEDALTPEQDPSVVTDLEPKQVH